MMSRVDVGRYFREVRAMKKSAPSPRQMGALLAVLLFSSVATAHAEPKQDLPAWHPVSREKLDRCVTENLTIGSVSPEITDQEFAAMSQQDRAEYIGHMPGSYARLYACEQDVTLEEAILMTERDKAAEKKAIMKGLDAQDRMCESPGYICGTITIEH